MRTVKPPVFPHRPSKRRKVGQESNGKKFAQKVVRQVTQQLRAGVTGTTVSPDTKNPKSMFLSGNNRKPALE